MQNKAMTMLKMVIFLVGTALYVQCNKSFADVVSMCGEHPIVANEEVKAAIEGQANLLFRRLGQGQISGQLATSRRDIFIGTPEGVRGGYDRTLLADICAFLAEDNTMSTSEKIQQLKNIQNKFSDPKPVAGSVFGGWLNYAIGPCIGKGTGDISCEGIFENTSSSDHVLATFITQKSGIRINAFDHFGLITAFDNNGASYKASSFQAANRPSGETGQFGFTLLPGIKTKIVIGFDNVDLSATSFARLTIPFADQGKADGRKLDMVIPNIPFQ